VWLTGCLGPPGRRWLGSDPCDHRLPDRAQGQDRHLVGERGAEPSPRRSLVLARLGHIHLSTFAREAADQSRRHSDEKPPGPARHRPIRRCVTRGEADKGVSDCYAHPKSPATASPSALGGLQFTSGRFSQPRLRPTQSAAKPVSVAIPTPVEKPAPTARPALAPKPGQPYHWKYR